MPNPATEGEWLGPFVAPGHTYEYDDSALKHVQDGVFVVHAVMLRTGRILIWSGHAENMHNAYARHVWEWDPLAAPIDPNNTAGWKPNPANAIKHTPSNDVFCCFHVQLQDGRILLMGGADHAHDAFGIPQVSTFDPMHGGTGGPVSFDPRMDMWYGRWYPTAVLMEDDRVLVFSGHRAFTDPISDINSLVEVFREAKSYDPEIQGTLSLMGAGGVPFYGDFPTYPGMHLVPGNRIVHSGTTWRYETPRTAVPNPPPPATQTGFRAVPDPTYEYTINQADMGAWQLKAGPLQLRFPEREEGTSILLSRRLPGYPDQIGQILVIGGGHMDNLVHTGIRFPNMGPDAPLLATLLNVNNSTSAEVLSTQIDPPSWGTPMTMNHPRINASAVNLVDGTVLILGGHNLYKWCPITANDGTTSLTQPTLPCEIFDPDFVAKGIPAFKVVASLHEPRMYHSAALLLPDGSVFVGGGANGAKQEMRFSDSRVALAEPVAINNTLRDPNGAVTDRQYPMPLNQKTIEFYRPPYLYIDGGKNRPKITKVLNGDGAEDKIHYGREFMVEFTAVTTIERVIIIRPGAMTHHTDTEQRHIPLPFTANGTGKVRVSMWISIDKSVAPAGFYMLFLMDKDGRVCERARFVQLQPFLASLLPTVPVPATGGSGTGGTGGTDHGGH